MPAATAVEVPYRDLNGNGITGAGGDRQDIYNFLSFEPESVESFEAGYKASLFDRRLKPVIAAFLAEPAR